MKAACCSAERSPEPYRKRSAAQPNVFRIDSTVVDVKRRWYRFCSNIGVISKNKYFRLNKVIDRWRNVCVFFYVLYLLLRKFVAK